MNTATRCAYTALTLSPARASHTRQLPGGASCDPVLFFPLGVLPASGGAAGPFPFLAARPRHSYPGRSAPVPTPGHRGREPAAAAAGDHVAPAHCGGQARSDLLENEVPAAVPDHVVDDA